MKLRNKKTGEIVEATDFDIMSDYNSLAELNEEWEDYEEPKGFWSISVDATIEHYDRLNENDRCKEIGNYFDTREQAEQAVEKLKAWKRLRDKDFQFHGHNALGVGEITFSLDFEDMDDEGEIGQLRHDLDLLFGGEE